MRVNELNKNQLADVRNQKIGFIFQKLNIINTLSEKENIMLTLIFKGIQEIEKKRNLALSVAAISAVTVFGIILSI